MKSERFGVNMTVQFSSEAHQGMGVIRNLSLTGALIETNAPVSLDDQLTLIFTLPNHPRPLEIPFAAVRWVCGHQLGVEFMTMATPTLGQIAEYLTGLKKESTWAPILEKQAA